MEQEILTVCEEIELTEFGILIYEYPTDDGVIEDQYIELIDRVLWEDYPFTFTK